MMHDAIALIIAAIGTPIQSFRHSSRTTFDLIGPGQS
jgi:hypothetical protein